MPAYTIEVQNVPTRLVDRKLVTPEEAYAKAIDKERLMRKFEASNVRVDLESGDVQPN